MVDAQAALLPHLPEPRRQRGAEYLAELTMLSQAYRHFAAGWISHRELQRRGRVTAQRLESMSGRGSEQLTDWE